MKKNVNEIPEFIGFAEKLGIDEIIFRVMRVNPDYAKRYDEKFLKENFVTQDELRKMKSKIKTKRIKVIFKEGGRCMWPWQGLYVTWDGEVTPCCVILDSNVLSLGNLVKEDFKKIWYSKRFINFRKDLIERKTDLCKGCRNW